MHNLTQLLHFLGICVQSHVKVIFFNMKFKDYFSTQADLYAQNRPKYPTVLYDFLSFHVAQKKNAWDCATGNGQVAVAIADFIENVVATDASQAQIDHAFAHPKVRYAVATAEKTDLPNAWANLITVGQALHWFDFEAFFAEVSRVAAPNALLAVWGYETCRLSRAIDAVYDKLYGSILDDYWAPERRYVENQYKTIPFPFEKLPTPDLTMEMQMGLNNFAGYLNSWSATQKYLQQNGQNPIDLVWDDLCKAWGPADKVYTARFPVFMLAAHVK